MATKKRLTTRLKAEADVMFRAGQSRVNGVLLEAADRITALEAQVNHLKLLIAVRDETIKGGE